MLKLYNVKRQLFLLFLATGLILTSCNDDRVDRSLQLNAAKIKSGSSVLCSKNFKGSFSIIIVSDWGWNGCKFQKPVADQMSAVADTLDARFIVSCGDNFQINGVASVQDPLWITNFENVYKGLPLQVEWFPVLGNHDYRGNTDAEIAYSGISRRWRMTDHYYTFAREINDSVSARFIFLDTPPLVSSYHKKPDEYPDVVSQDTAKEIRWLKNVLSESKEKWILVFGHHPVFSASKKHGDTEEMISRVKPLLDQYHVQLYFCGHDHDFQHLHEKNHSVDYVVTGTGGDTRGTGTNELSLFSKAEPGFSAVTFKGDSLKVRFINVKGEVIYSFSRGNK